MSQNKLFTFVNPVESTNLITFEADLLIRFFMYEFLIERTGFDKIPLAKRDRAFLEGLFRPQLPFPDTEEGLRKKIDDRKKFPFFRKELHRVLIEQYDQFPNKEKVLANINRLPEDNCFTVTTAHQASLFTGPMYTVYKAASTIHLARHLQNRFPEYSFVPVFVLGAEDHDFEEINHLHLYNKRIEWQVPHGGPTGRLPPDGLEEVVSRLAGLLPQTDHASRLIEELRQIIHRSTDYGEVSRRWLHFLFGEYGLVVLNPDDSQLKKIASGIFRLELLERPSYSIVQQALHELKEAGYKPQAKPRELNLFYMTDTMRRRLVFESGKYRVLDTDLIFSEEAILDELAEFPERFSPNVIMRPLYQEWILPNIAYIGGGGELAYWQERPGQFAHFGVSFPVLIRRNSALFVDAYSKKLLNKLHLLNKDILLTTNELLPKLSNNSDINNVEQELELLHRSYDMLAQKAESIDSGLSRRILAEKAKQTKAFLHLHEKMRKAQKERHQQQLSKFEKLRARLFPEGKLQERHDNFLAVYADYGPEAIQFLTKEWNPLDRRFIIWHPAQRQGA